VPVGTGPPDPFRPCRALFRCASPSRSASVSSAKPWRST